MYKYNVNIHFVVVDAGGESFLLPNGTYKKYEYGEISKFMRSIYTCYRIMYILYDNDYSILLLVYTYYNRMPVIST